MTENNIEEFVVENKTDEKTNPITGIKKVSRQYHSVTLTFNSREARDAWMEFVRKDAERQVDKRWIYSFSENDYDDKWVAHFTMQMDHTEER